MVAVIARNRNGRGGVFAAFAVTRVPAFESHDGSSA